MSRPKVKTELPQRTAVTGPDGGVRFEEPRKDQTGETNAQLLQKFYKERSLPESWFDPDAQRFFTTTPKPADNDQVRKMIEVMLSGDESARRAIIQSFNNLDGKQQRYWLTRIASELPNPRSDVGFSPQAQELVDFLQGKPPAVSVRRKGEATDYGPDRGLRENIEIVPDRAETIEKVRQAGDVSPRVKATERNLGEPAQEFTYDDTAAFDDAGGSSPVLNEAPGDIQTQPGLPPRPSAASVLKRLPPGHPIKDELEARDFLRSGKEGEFDLILGDNNKVLPAFMRGPDGSRRIGPQDYPSWKQGVEYEAGELNYEQAVAEAVNARFGSAQNFVKRLNAARAARDTDTVDALNAEMLEVLKSVEGAKKGIPRKPYPLAGKKGEFLAAQSNRSEQDVFTDAVRQIATAKSSAARADALDRAWQHVQKEKGRTLTPADPASGLMDVKDANGNRIPPAEVMADIFLSLHKEDAAAFRPEYRRAIVDAINERYFSPANRANAKADPNATVVTDTGGTAKLGEERKRLRNGSDPDPDTMDYAEKDRFNKATKDVGVSKGEEEYQTLPDKPLIDGLPAATSPEQLAEMRAKDLEHWKLGRLNAGKIVFKDGDTWKALYITDKTSPKKIDSVLAKAKASAGELGEEGQASLERLIHPWDTSSSPTGRSSNPASASVREPAASRDAVDAARLRLDREDWARATGHKNVESLTDDELKAIVERPPGWVRRPPWAPADAGKIVPSLQRLTPEEAAWAHDEWAKQGGVNWGRSDVPYPGNNPPKKVQDQFDVGEDPGPGAGYEGPEVGDPDAPVVNAPKNPAARPHTDDLLQEIVDVIDDPNASPEDLAWARSQRDEARARHDAEEDEDVRAAFRRDVLDPINAAAARRRARANPTPATTPDVESNLEASATPIEPESLPGSRRPDPVPETPDAQANRKADAEEAARDIEGETADANAKADAERNADNLGRDGSDVDETDADGSRAMTTTPRKPADKDPRWFPRTRDHLWKHKGKYATGAALTGFGTYALSPTSTPATYAFGQDPLGPAGEGGEGISAEDRIRQIIHQRMQNELIPHTSQRYY